jgi:urease accessory protein
MRLLQFGDSVLPVGAFSFSNGLESAIQANVVNDRATLKEFVATATEQAARSDGIALLEAHRAAMRGDLDRVLFIDGAVHNRKLNEEIRTMTIRMGRKLGEMCHHVLKNPLMEQWLTAIKQDKTPGTYPVGQAIVFAILGLSEYDAFAVHQYGVASMMLSAALRLMKIHHLDGQAILFEVNSATEQAFERAAQATLDDMAVFAPVMDILTAVHVKSHVRMFMN